MRNHTLAPISVYHIQLMARTFTSITESDAIIISNCEETAAKSDDDSNHNTENGESKVINEIENKESNANDVANVNEENQNCLEANDEDSQLNAVRDLIAELKDMYNEFLLQIKLVQKDLIRSAKYDELESKVSRSSIRENFCKNFALKKDDFVRQIYLFVH